MFSPNSALKAALSRTIASAASVRSHCWLPTESVHQESAVMAERGMLPLVPSPSTVGAEAWTTAPPSSGSELGRPPQSGPAPAFGHLRASGDGGTVFHTSTPTVDGDGTNGNI